VRGKRRHGRAQVLPPDSAEFRSRAEAGFRRSPLIPWIFGVDFDRQAGLTAAQVRQLGGHAAIVRITLDS
jgi:hypothetical protein